MYCVVSRKGSAMSPTYTLTELQYSQDRKGPFALYEFYEPNSEYHRGPQWFAEKVDYPDEEITIAKAHELYAKVFAAGREIRITDGGKHLCIKLVRLCD